MSHIVEAKTTIKMPNLALLQRAVTIVAKLHAGGRISNTYHDFSLVPWSSDGHRPVHRPMHRGIGLDIKDGYLNIVGDPWGVEGPFHPGQG